MKRTNAELNILQKLTLETKELYFNEKAIEFIEFCDAQEKEPVVSVSGGLDSTVMGYLLRRISKDIRFVFSNTGQEFTAIANFARNMGNTAVVLPRMNFKEVVSKFGFPAIDKGTARKISDLQNPTLRNEATRKLRMTGVKRDGSISRDGKLADCWKYMVGGPRISNRCCDVLKKEPLKRFARENNALFFIGERAQESSNRRDAWVKRGCNSYDSSHQASYPLAIFTHHDILLIILKYDIPYCREIYGNIYSDILTKELKTTGERGTGCVGCLFGAPRFDRLRYVRLYKIDPKKHEYCMEAGAKEILEWLEMPAYSDDGPLYDKLTG